MKRILLAAMAALLLSTGTAWADPLEDGVAAYQRGDYAAAVARFRPLATQGDSNAQFNLGMMYRKGQGAEQNFAEAVKWYRLAAAQGVTSAQFNLGVMYDQEKGMAQNNAEAAKWYRLAAAQGHAGAQANLGVMFDQGRAVRLPR